MPPGIIRAVGVLAFQPLEGRCWLVAVRPPRPGVGALLFFFSRYHKLLFVVQGKIL